MRGRAQLVCQHLEDVSRAVLEEHQEKRPHFMVHVLFTPGLWNAIPPSEGVAQRHAEHCLT